MPVSPAFPRSIPPMMSDQVAALRFAVGLPQQVCEDALARCHGDTAKAEQLLRSASRVAPRAQRAARR